MRVAEQRVLWRLVEPYHAVTYFAPEPRAAFEAAGLRGFWRGYFAGRAAPLGAAGPGVVTAVFYGFHPDFVARAVPSVWSLASPAQALTARLAGVDAALRTVLADELDGTAVRSAADLARTAAEQANPAGRPLFAANAELDWPTEPHLALWHATTLLREHRGDGHVAALTAAEVGPCEAHVLRVAATGEPVDTIKPHRGWDDEHWAAAADRLRERGWLDDGSLTNDGRAVYDAIEADTDRLAIAPSEQLVDALSPVAAIVLRSAVIPYPNAVGVPPPPA